MKIQSILEENFDVEILSMDENLLEVSGFDSMNLVEFLTLLDTKGVEVTFEEILNVKNLQELEELINERI